MSSDVQTRLAGLLSGLNLEDPVRQNLGDRDALAELEALLIQSHLDDPGSLIPRELSIERAVALASDVAPEERQLRLDQLAEGAEPQFRVFRRETPMAAPMLNLSVPAWARGVQPERTLGPFRSPDDRLYWFDFFPIVRMVPLYFAGDPQPAMLFYERDRLSIFDRIRHRHSLVKSSIWVRANLFAAAAPVGSYVGLRIGGGTLRFSVDPTNVVGKLTMPAGSTCAVSLDLAASPAAAPSAGEAGRDAADAVLNTPATLQFELRAGHATPAEVARASWQVYGLGLDFAWNQDAAPSFEPALQSVLIPMSVKEQVFRPQTIESPFGAVAGEARITRAAWTLPVSTLDIKNPTEAAGSGGVAVQTGKGLTLSWPGLRDGPIVLPAPWIAGGPGLIAIVELAASNIYAHQRFLLWKDADSKFRSEMELRYTKSFLVIYTSAANGSEGVLAQTNVEAKIDRPVNVKGTPFPIHTLKSQLSLIYTDDRQFAFVYDDNILVDALDPAATWPAEPKRNSLAIRNALFAITPVNNFFLFAELQDEEMVRRASLSVGMGLCGLLPSLPDPYAANVGWLRTLIKGGKRQPQPGMLLFGAVRWAKAAGEGPDAVTTTFTLAPLTPLKQTLEVWDAAGRGQGEVNAALTGIEGDQWLSLFKRGNRYNQGDWDRYFAVFQSEQFSLLDVSTNADQMGVGFAWFNERAVSDNELVFYQIYKPVAPGAQATFPLQVQELDLSAQSRYVRAFTLPQVSWEPVYNLTPPPSGIADPPAGWNLYPNDGGPTRLFNNSVQLVPIAPIPVTEFLAEDFKDRNDGFTGALFTLPFGLRAFAKFSRDNPFGGMEPGHLGLFRPEYEGGNVRGAMQLRADAPKHPVKSPTMEGATFQLNNVLTEGGAPTFTTTLGASVSFIFNKQFYYDGDAIKTSGVPLSRIDFSGYGANVFSHWEDPSGAIAAASKAYFDVYSGRTAQEVIQVRSLLMPWCVRVVRTITLTRASDGYVFRYDTGWQAETEGIYDCRYKVFDDAYQPVDRPNPYEFHPGLVKGVFNVRNIKETSAVAPFISQWQKKLNDDDVDSEGIAHKLTSAPFPQLAVFFQPAYFDADVQIEGVLSGPTNGRVPSKGMLGYIQLAPRGEPIPPELFRDMLQLQFGSLGGPVDCVIDIGKSGQRMRVSRVDVSASTDGTKPIFVGTARGALLLPKEGSWSVVQHNQGTGEVSPLDQQTPVPVIRRGKLSADATATDTMAADLLRVANPVDLVTPLIAATRNYGLLQSTNTQKVLFRLPSFEQGVAELKSDVPNFADAYRLVNSKGIFPNVQDTEPMNLGAFKTKIIAEGYKLLNEAAPAAIFEHAMAKGPLRIVDESFLKIYIEYGTAADALQYGFDSSALAAGKQWLSKMSEIVMVVDLGSIQRLMTITGKFDTEKGAKPGFRDPDLQFHKDLKPIVDLLQILASLQSGDYKAAFGKGLDVAMSNSADSWNYSLHAKQEIPLVRFPPGITYDAPTNPLKLEAHMAIGVYFNESLAIPSAPSQLIPSAGAFLEFGGSLSVMCVSLAAATVYAVGTVDLRMAADIKTGPSLHMKFGFGAEIAVGLPVVGTVSVLYMVGVQIDLDTGGVEISAFLLFRGRAEILGGIVTVQIQIEAKGTVKDRVGSSTEMAAQVTFGLDVSIFLVINLHFSKSWEESRQIA